MKRVVNLLSFLLYRKNLVILACESSFCKVKLYVRMCTRVKAKMVESDCARRLSPLVDSLFGEKEACGGIAEGSCQYHAVFCGKKPAIDRTKDGAKVIGTFSQE